MRNELSQMTTTGTQQQAAMRPAPACKCGHPYTAHDSRYACTRCDSCTGYEPQAAAAHRCQKPGCGGILRSEASIKRGMSRDCDRKVRHALAAAAEAGRFTPEQAEKADAAIRSGHVRELAPGLYGVQSSRDAAQWYATDGNSCTCPAGSRSHPLRCWQLLAARVFAAVARPAQSRTAFRTAA